MSTNNFINLQLQVESLLQTHHQLHKENHDLRSRLAKLIQQRAILLNSKEKICKKIKSLISQIRNETA